MMLFIIGLELNPASFWKMRNQILGMGGLQMGLTTALLFPLFYFALGVNMNAALALALSCSMSSTAIVLQTLKEKGIEQTQSGESSFAVLLFQDIAVIPILAFLPVLAPALLSAAKPAQAGAQTAAHAAHGAAALPSSLSANPVAAWLAEHPTLLIALAALVVFLASKFLIGPLLRAIAKTHMRELFTAAALCIVIGFASLMEFAGLSPALGAFMAGVLLANSEYRHQLESDIEPFKGILLGLFFTAVGSTINFSLIASQPLAVCAAVAMIMLVKCAVLGVIGRIFSLPLRQTALFVLLLSQVGEFAFVLLNSSGQLQVIDKERFDFFMAVAAMSMVISPVALFIYEKYLVSRFQERASESGEERAADDIHGEHRVIIAGFSHFGSTLGRFLRANGVQATILDNDVEQVTLLRKMGFTVYYGDATRLDLLHAAGAEKASVLICAIGSVEKREELAEVAQKHFPHLKIFMRARNRYEAYDFLENGVERVYRETLHTSVQMGVDALHELGVRKYTALRKAQEFIAQDEQTMRVLAQKRHDAEGYISHAREAIAEQERILSEDRKFAEQKHDNAWDKTGLLEAAQARKEAESKAELKKG
jgi:CPA2 family monovalent cation:H+ antiporter-2